MPNLREHIDIAVARGIPRPIAVLVNYEMGMQVGDPEETDISLLTDEERIILKEQGLIDSG